MPNEGHAPRSGRLKNGNTPGDLRNAARCGARTRRGTPCQGPAIANGRCRMHGGPSTGPRTPEGLAQSAGQLEVRDLFGVVDRDLEDSAYQ